VCAQKVDRLGRVHILPGAPVSGMDGVAGKVVPVLGVKVEVELPGAGILRKVPLLVCESQSYLDRLEQVDVTPHRLVMVIRRGLERTDWTSNDAWKLRILLHTSSRALATRIIPDKVRVGL